MAIKRSGKYHFLKLDKNGKISKCIVGVTVTMQWYKW
jgi:hypothetical protein